MHTAISPLPGKRQNKIVMEVSCLYHTPVLKPLPVNTLLITFIMLDISYLLIKLEDDTSPEKITKITLVSRRGF